MLFRESSTSLRVHTRPMFNEVATRQHPLLTSPTNVAPSSNSFPVNIHEMPNRRAPSQVTRHLMN